ncbi:MAG: Fic family protein [Prevotellaceae bacterium]|nr:Fic family protein [Prevotellaceae bacterium]
MAIELPPKHSEKKDSEIISALWSSSELQEVLTRISDDYLYWDKVKHLAPKDMTAEHLWQAVKLQRKTELQRVKFGKYTFSFNVTTIMQSLLHDFDLNMGGSLSADGIIPNNDKQIYLVSSIMEEAIASSQMEGASTTRKVAKDMLRKKLSPMNKSQQMILNNYHTIQQLNEQKDKVLTMDVLLEIHQNISEHTLDNPADEGRLRNTDDIYVMDAINGEIAHTPPSYTEIDSILQDVFTFANEDNPKRFIHPIVKGIILHFMIAWIHPFVDGNGRTARSLVYWYLLKKGYWLTEYLSISRIIYKNKKRYERMFLYTEADDKDMTYFILYNLQVMKKAYEDLKLYLARKQEERKSILMYNDIDGINARQMGILRLLDEAPSSILLPQEVASRFGVSERTARNDLQTLTDMGKLKKVAINKKQTGFIMVR